MKSGWREPTFHHVVLPLDGRFRRALSLKETGLRENQIEAVRHDE